MTDWRSIRYGWEYILNQDPWETLISFIISANNNITRIKVLLKNCQKIRKANFREGNEGSPAFPSSLSTLPDEEDLKACGCGL